MNFYIIFFLPSYTSIYDWMLCLKLIRSKQLCVSSTYSHFLYKTSARNTSTLLMWGCFPFVTTCCFLTIFCYYVWWGLSKSAYSNLLFFLFKLISLLNMGYMIFSDIFIHLINLLQVSTWKYRLKKLQPWRGKRNIVLSITISGWKSPKTSTCVMGAKSN